MQLRTTSTERTYRYVRLSIIGVALLLAVSLAAQSVSGGLLPSVSAMYYTAARNVFVGGLCAVALALLALSGRSVEQALLDIAAVFAPVIAFVPTPVETGDVPGVAVSCPTDRSCVPAALVPEIANGVLAVGVVGLSATLGAVVVAVAQRTLTVGTGVTIAAVGALLVGMLGWGMLAPEAFLLGAHHVATAGFFALIAVVAALAAFRPATRAPRRHRALRLSYAIIAAGMVASLVFVVIVVVLRASGIEPIEMLGLPPVLVGEGAALVLFAAFWTVQTIEVWNDPDRPLAPSSVAM